MTSTELSMYVQTIRDFHAAIWRHIAAGPDRLYMSGLIADEPPRCPTPLEASIHAARSAMEGQS